MLGAATARTRRVLRRAELQLEYLRRELAFNVGKKTIELEHWKTHAEVYAEELGAAAKS